MFKCIVNKLKNIFCKEKHCKQFDAFVDMHQVHEENVMYRLSTIESKIDILEQQKAALTAILDKIEKLIAELKEKK